MIHLYNKAIPARSLHKNLHVARRYKNDLMWDKGNQKGPQNNCIFIFNFAEKAYN